MDPESVAENAVVDAPDASLRVACTVVIAYGGDDCYTHLGRSEMISSQCIMEYDGSDVRGQRGRHLQLGACLGCQIRAEVFAR